MSTAKYNRPCPQRQDGLHAIPEELCAGTTLDTVEDVDSLELCQEECGAYSSQCVAFRFEGSTCALFADLVPSSSCSGSALVKVPNQAFNLPEATCPQGLIASMPLGSLESREATCDALTSCHVRLSRACQIAACPGRPTRRTSAMDWWSVARRCVSPMHHVVVRFCPRYSQSIRNLGS